MMAWDVFIGVIGIVIVVSVVRSLISRIASGNVVPKELSDWQDYTWIATALLIVASWIIGSSFLNMRTAGTVLSAMALIFLVAHLILQSRTSRNDRRGS